MTANTLKITFQQEEEIQTAGRERLRRAEAGESGEGIEQEVAFVLNFEEFEDIAQLMRPSNLELVEAIVSDRPESIRAAAAVVDRDYRDVHRNLETLESLGVVEFESQGNRKRPILREGAQNIEFSIQFPQRAENEDPPGASV
jgi:predicted transcriptional regulator